MDIYKILIFCMAFCLYNTISDAKLAPEESDFINETFLEHDLKAKKLIIKGDLKKDIKLIMGKYYKKIIMKYWEREGKTLWILNSIGKYKPITAGFVVEKCSIKEAKVLIYREPIGYEIKYPNFLNKLVGLVIKENIKLDRNIDNISGATLSVNSMDRMARTALILDNISNDNKW